MRNLGRPRLDDDRLADMVSDAASDVMGRLGAYAARHRFTLAGLAAKLGCTPLAVRHFFETKKPREKTICRMAEALGLSPVATRALTNSLDRRDAFNLRQSVLRTVLERGAIFGDAFAVQGALVAVLDAAPLDKRYAALAEFAIAAAGLGEKSELFTLADALGFDLDACVAGEAHLQERMAEMLLVRDWALERLPFSADDRGSIAALFTRYVKPSDQAPRHALAATVAEYHRRRKEPETLASVLTGFTPSMKGTKP